MPETLEMKTLGHPRPLESKSFSISPPHVSHIFLLYSLLRGLLEEKLWFFGEKMYFKELWRHVEITTSARVLQRRNCSLSSPPLPFLYFPSLSTGPLFLVSWLFSSLFEWNTPCLLVGKTLGIASLNASSFHPNVFLLTPGNGTSIL